MNWPKMAEHIYIYIYEIWPTLLGLHIYQQQIWGHHMIFSGHLRKYTHYIYIWPDICCWWLYQWDQNIATPMGEMCGLQEGLCWKIKLIWSHSIKVSWLAYKFFSRPLYVCMYGVIPQGVFFFFFFFVVGRQIIAILPPPKKSRNFGYKNTFIAIIKSNKIKWSKKKKF